MFLKLGPEGVIVSDGKHRERLPAVKVKAVDATGAGDCFCGAALARLAAGDSIWEAAKYANAAAALATTGYGAVDPLPRPEEVRKLLFLAMSALEALGVSCSSRCRCIGSCNGNSRSSPIPPIFAAMA